MPPDSATGAPASNVGRGEGAGISPPSRSAEVAQQGPRRGSQHGNEDSIGGDAGEARRLLARGELPLGGPDLPVRQSPAEAPAGAIGREAHAPGALGHDAGPELHLRAPEPRHREVRPRHDLRVGPRARGARGRGEHLPGGHLQRNLSGHLPGRGRTAEALPPVLVPRGDPQPRLPGNSGLHPRRRRAGLLAQPFLRGRLRQSGSGRGLRRGRRRSRDGAAGHFLALQQVPGPRHRRRGPAHPAPQRLQDLQSDRPRPHHARRAGPASAGLRLDALLRQRARERAHARSHGTDPGRGGGTDPRDPARGPRGRGPHPPAMAHDRPGIPERDGRVRRWWTA